MPESASPGCELRVSKTILRRAHSQRVDSTCTNLVGLHEDYLEPFYYTPCVTSL